MRRTQITPTVAKEPADIERSWYSSFALRVLHHMLPMLSAASVLILLYGTVSQYESYVRAHCSSTATLCSSKYDIALQFTYRYTTEIPLHFIETQTCSVSEAVLGAREFRLCQSLPTQLASFPPHVVGKFGLKRIVFCKELTHRGNVCGGLTRAQEGIIFLSSVLYDERRIKNAPARCFYHEVFHLLDHAMGVSDLSQYDAAVDFERDFGWESLNHESVRYGARWRTYSSELKAKAITPGIWTYYSLSSPAEDKAVIFSHLMTDYERITNCSKRDKILERKINLLKYRLFSFDSYFDESFWLARAPRLRETRM